MVGFAAFVAVGAWCTRGVAALEVRSAAPLKAAAAGGSTLSLSSSLSSRTYALSEAKEARRRLARLATSRPVCARCDRPPSVCVCCALPAAPIATRTRVLVLQHPNEFRKKICSTVPLLPLNLAHVQVRVGYEFGAACLELPEQTRRRKPLLLFPSTGAIAIDEAGPAAALLAGGGNNDDDDGGGGGHLLVLIDGTWSQARTMVRRSPELLAATQHVKFAAAALSDIHALRREPAAHCVSTLEACALALTLLEPTAAVDTAARHLGDSLRTMVKHQLNLKDRAPRFVRR